MNAQVEKLTRHSKNYAMTKFVGAVLEKIEPTISPTFLVSFPRSGNGFVRYIVAKVALAANSYDLGALVEDRYQYVASGGRARRFTEPITGEQISIEDIAPDLHMNSVEHLADISPRFHFHGGPLVKSHYSIPDNVARYIYLYRDPSQCTASLFDLNAGSELLERVLAGHDLEIYHECLRVYLRAYVGMGRHAIRHARSGQCKLLPLARIEDGEHGMFLDLLVNGFRNITCDDVEKILSTNPKHSLYDKRLHELVDLHGDVAHDEAQQVFGALNAIAK